MSRRPPRAGTAPVDLAAEMTTLVRRMGGPGPDGGRAVQFVAARAGEGTSTVARAFALAAAAEGLRTWLVELDLISGVQSDALQAGAHGPPGPAAAVPGPAFFEVSPPAPDDAGLLEARRLAGAPLWVTRFRREALAPGRRLGITGAADAWAGLKRRADLVVVDAPSADVSRAAAAVAPHMDATLIVVGADHDDPSGPALLRAGLTAVGGRCAGAVLNRAPARPPAFLRRLAS